MTRAFIAIAMLTAGCAAEKVWLKDGASKGDFRVDSGQCRAQAFGLSPGASVMQVAIVYNGCLEGRGWVLSNKP